jgi:hypothetical protein
LARASISRLVCSISRSNQSISTKLLSSRARRLAQRQLGEEAAAARAEEVSVLVLDALAGEQGVDAVLQRRAHPRQRHAVAKEIAQVAQLTRRDVRLR